MGVNCPGDVFQSRAHPDRQNEGRGEFTDVGANRLQAENKVVVRARDDADKTFVVLERRRAAVGRERKARDLRRHARPRGLIGRKADGDNLRVGVADGGGSRAC